MNTNLAQNSYDFTISGVTLQTIHSKGYSLKDPISTTADYDQINNLHVTLNRITIDKGTLLAKSPNQINNDWLTNSTTADNFLDKHIKQLHLFINAKRKQPATVKMLNCLLSNLLNAHNTQSQLLYSRRKTDSNYKTVPKIADYLASQGLIYNVIGKANEYQGNQSFMIPTDKLIVEMKAAKVRVMLNNDAPMIEVRAAKVNGKRGDNLSIKRIATRQNKLYKSCIESVQAHNKLWLNHEVTLDDRHLVPFVNRIFNLSLSNGGRFYGASHLILPSQQREQLLIDGEQTIEPDFKAMHYCLLYAMEGIELNPLINDPYIINGYDRKTIKLASLVLLNSENIPAF
ncbi:MAG TPA: hypothetical protein EYN54_09195, partial [Methylococcaceae bacterium]|nr:hypothetical protein [Methylococcaceae bacterium]